MRDRKERFQGHGDLSILAVRVTDYAPADFLQQKVKVEVRLDPVLPWEETEQYTDLLTLTWNGDRWFPSGLRVIDVERLPVTKPVMPDAAAEPTIAGALAWLDHYYAMANYSHLTWDWAPLLALHAGHDRDQCQAIPDGYRLAGPGDIKRSPIAGTRTEVSANGRQVSIVTGVDRIQPGAACAYERYIDRVTLTWHPGPRPGWRVEQLNLRAVRVADPPENPSHREGNVSPVRPSDTDSPESAESAASAGLWTHQLEAVKAVIAEIALGGRCRITMACGTGKTLVGAEVSRQVAETGRVLVVMPTLELLAQTARSYVAHLGTHAGMVVAVCSDFGAQTMDASQLHAALDELHVGVSTNPRDVAEWSRQHGRITVLCTYASLPVIAAAGATGVSWDLLVVDEAHRSAGRIDRAWHIIHQDEAIPARRRLYMTATPRIIGTDRVEATSMDDPGVFGPEVYQMPFARAIEEGLLADYKVLVTTMTEAELGKLDTGPNTVVNAGGPALPAQMLAAQLALLKAHAEYGVRRLITFHHRVASAKQFARTLPNAADLLPAAGQPERMYAAAVDGSMSMEERRGILRHLDRPAGRFVVISNARVLGEGVDVPELDGVVFADPRDSATDVVQAVGRALRRGRSESKTAYIIVPILIHETETVEAALDSSAWDVLYRVLRALRAHDERIGDDLDTRRAGLTASDHVGVEPSNRYELPSWLSLTGTMVDRSFAEALQLRVLERTTSIWLEGLGAARTFHKLHGHLRVPRRYVTDDQMALGTWISSQRKGKRKHILAAERVQALDDLGMIWDAYEAEWEEWLDAARAFRSEHGHLRTRNDVVVNGRELGAWIVSQRVLKRKGDLSQKRIADLDALGMVWDAREALWYERLAEARAYYAKNGHLRVPHSYVAPNGVKLGVWISGQRKRKASMTEDQIEQLDTVGMEWSPHDTSWRNHLAAASAYRAEHGHLRVPHTYVTPEGIHLGAWITAARQANRKASLASDRIADLDELGIEWEIPQSTWELKVATARAFHDEHGHLRVPSDHVVEGFNLSKWLTELRKRRSNGQLTPDQIAALDEAGMDWDPRQTVWRHSYAALVAFLTEHCHLRVPSDYVTPDGLSLGRWVRNLRHRRRRGLLPEDRIKALDALGMEWDLNGREQQPEDRTATPDRTSANG